MNPAKKKYKVVLLLLCGFCLITCGGPVKTDSGAVVTSPRQMHPTAAWVLACRVGQTGFGCFPGDSAFTSRTGMALEVLDRLGALKNLGGERELVAWLKSRQQDDGGFLEAENYYLGKKLPWGTKSALEPTYWALRALDILGAAPDNPAAAAEFVNERRGVDGGYDAYEYAFGAAKEALYTTFWAVGALKILGLPVPDSAATLAWVRGMQNTMGERGGFSLSDDDWRFSSPAGCYYALRIFELLGGGPLRPGRARKFLLSDYGQEPDGGFEVGHNRGWRQNHYSRTEDTYYGVRALALLGTPLSDLDSSRAKRPRSDCIAWLSSRQNRDGGFGRFGISEHTLLPSPSEMRSTWHAVLALGQLGAMVPSPADPVTPRNEVQVHVPRFRHPCVNCDDPVEVWAYRRIALPIYRHFLQLGGSKLEALGRVNRWASTAIGPHNGSWITQGRGILMHGWGQCGGMSWLMQELATSVDFAARASFIIADVNLEISVQEEGWTEPHWCLFVPFTQEFPNPAILPPDRRDNGWSVLDMAVDYRLRRQDPSRPRPTRIADRLFANVRVETIDTKSGKWGKEFPVDTTTTYDSPVADSLYPGGSW